MIEATGSDFPIQPRNAEIVAQYIITAKSFIEEGYEAKIAAGECEVFDVLQPPDSSASDQEKKHWEEFMEEFGNGIKVTRITDLSGGYYSIDGQMVDENYQLIVFPNPK